MELTYVEKAHNVLNEVNKAVLGKKTEVAEIMTAFLANGHVLLEDIPGVGKTTLATAFSKAMGLESRRVQFTPDVMPSDLTGFSVYRREEEKFVYQEGSIFCNILLADEINRTSPKTQSALLEVMEERKVSVDGVTRDAPSPFLVIATQNPSGTAGTQLLPEAQIDRFMITLTLGYPDYLSELEIARTAGSGSRNDNIQPVITKEDFLTMQQQIHETYIKDIVYDYIIKLIKLAVGFGFAVAEEFYYGDFSSQGDAADYVSFVARMISVPAHMTFNMVMGELLGRAKFSRLTGKGSPALYCVLAILIPMGVHTLVDACTAFNSKLMSGEMIGILMALAGYVGMLVFELVVLIRFRKKTAKFCDMRLSAAEPAA